MKKYINIKNGKNVETVDEFDYNTIEQKKEAKRCLREYILADTYNNYYLSKRCTKDWNNIN